jgi:purine-binding chemotaxis protein CheW
MPIQQICTFFINDSYFGIEVEQVQEIIRPQHLTFIPLAPPDVCGLMNLRGQVLPVVDLPCRLGLRACRLPEQAVSELDNGYNIIVKNSEDIVSFMVDEVGDVLQCLSESFEPPPATLNGSIRFFLKGAYKLEQGFLLILDTLKILEPSAIDSSTHSSLSSIVNSTKSLLV